MNKKSWISAIFSLIAIFSLVFPAQADGIIIPEPPICDPAACPPPCQPVICPPCGPGNVCPPCAPPIPCPPINPFLQLSIKYHHVTVNIDNQIATTKVDQVFYNPNSYSVEGTYIFPLPVGAAVNNFMLWVDGQPVEGKVMDAAQARQVYEDLTRSRRDPALLEYVGRGAVQAKVDPIPAGGERRIQLEYVQTLTSANGLVQYLYPLNTEKFSSHTIDDVSITVDITSQQSLRAIYSPSHSVNVNRKDDQHASVSYEATNVKPDTDFSLFYSIGDTEAFHIFTYRDPNDALNPDGFFLMLLAPRPDAAQAKVAKDVILVLDHSGSMDGEKFQQAQTAAKYILNHLNTQDRFGLVTFSSGVEHYASGLRTASEGPEAAAWLDSISASGSTDINRALLEALGMADSSRPTYLIFLTDGQPTIGETDRQKIIDNFNQAAPPSIRLFTFGVGYDVDTFLLDSLAQAHHGLSTYVQPGQNLDEVISGFYESISIPVLTNLSLDFGGLSVSDIYPNPLPDLFSGSQVVVVGRYSKGGTTTVTLKGDVNGQSQTFTYTGQVFSADNQGGSTALTSLPRLWATRKVGYLLNQVRLKGPDKETIDQIVTLSIRYGIVTPYTSYLVTEPMPLGAENQQRVADNAYQKALAAPAPTTSGAGAVAQSAGQGALSQAQQAPSPVITAGSGSNGEVAQTVQVVGARTFIYNQGVWTDTAYDPGTMKPQIVQFLSDQYFALAEGHPELAAAFALGTQVIVVVDGKVYQVVGDFSSNPTPGPSSTQVAPTANPLKEGPGTPVVQSTGAPAAQSDPNSQTGPNSVLALVGLVIAAGAAAYLTLRGNKKER
jgi:Ca-activated chloride channel family protein